MLYVIAGNGTGAAKEITASLKDLKDKAAKDDVEFWFVLEGKDEPTATDQAIYKWLATQEVWFEVYTASDAAIEGAQEAHAVEDVFAAFLERIQERAEDSEDSSVLILPADPEGESDEDEALMAFVESAIDASVPVFQLNGEMAAITLEEEPEPEPEPAKAAGATKKAAAKKAAPAPAAAPVKKAAKKAASAPVAEEQDGAPNDPDEPTDGPSYTQAELTKMPVAELTAIARAQGIDTKGLGKKDLITAILTQTEVTPADEVDEVEVVETVVVSNGDAEGVLVVIHFNHAVVTRMIPEAEALALITQ